VIVEHHQAHRDLISKAELCSSCTTNKRGNSHRGHTMQQLHGPQIPTARCSVHSAAENPSVRWHGGSFPRVLQCLQVHTCVLPCFKRFTNTCTEAGEGSTVSAQHPIELSPYHQATYYVFETKCTMLQIILCCYDVKHVEAHQEGLQRSAHERHQPFLCCATSSANRSCERWLRHA
jgi:hypothetical protein